MIKKILGYFRAYGVIYTLKKIYYRFELKYKAGKKYFPFDIDGEERKKQTERIWSRKITFSIVVPMYNTPVEYLRELLDSVQNQTYVDWQLCLADAGDKNSEELLEEIERRTGRDGRIFYKKLSENKGISENTNEAIKMAKGEYIALLDHDDLLHPSALYYVAEKVMEGADFVYTDELSFVGNPDCVQSVHLKPDFSWESFRSNNYICHFTVFSKKLMEKAGAFRKEFDGSQDYDFFLRLTEQAQKICHIPRVLYYWRLHAGSVASGVEAKPYTCEAGKKALEEHLDRTGRKGQVEISEYGTFYHVKYQQQEKQKVIIGVENHNVKAWIEENLQETFYDVSVCCPKENTTVDVCEFHGEERMEKRKAFALELCQKAKKADYVVLVRDGYVPEQESECWLEELIGSLQEKSNGLAGSVVYTPSGKNDYSGYCYSLAWTEQIRPLYQGVPREDSAYMNRLRFKQSVSLLGGGTLAVKSALFQKSMMEIMEADICGLQSVFSDVVWFSMCLCGKREKKTSVLVPYEPFCRMQERSREVFSKKAYEREEVWEKFRQKYGKDMEEGDGCLNPQMVRLGRFYRLW